jgi:hypothetical protein
MEVLRYPTPVQRRLLLFSRQIQAHKIPAIVVEGCNLGLKVYTTLTLDNVMIAETLIPRDVVKDALAVHIDPCFLETENSACSEVDATVVEIVANGDLLECQAQRSSELDYMELTKALQFFIAQTWPTYPDVSAAPSVSNLHGYKGLSTRLTL